MRVALGVIVSAGFRVETDFLFGRPSDGGRSGPEGLIALQGHVQTGEANRALPDDRQITGLRTVLSRKFPTDVARNEICADVLKGDEDYLLFLDADMVHPATLLETLLLADKPVITARYHVKKPPFAAVAYVKHRTQEGPHRYASVHFGQGVFEIERGGAGALLIRRDVLQAIHDRIGHAWFRYQPGPEAPHDLTVSEDFWFYRQAREAGFSCWVDWDCECPHIGPMAVDSSWNRPFLHTQVSEYDNPETRDLVLGNTIVRGYPEGMYLGEDAAHHVPEYTVTPGGAMNRDALYLTPTPASGVAYNQGSIVVCYTCGKPLYRLQRSVYLGEPLGKSAWKYAPVTMADLQTLMERSDLEPGQRAAIKAMSIEDQRLHCDKVPSLKPGDFMDCAACGETFVYGSIAKDADGGVKFGDKAFAIRLATIPPVGTGRRVSA